METYSTETVSINGDKITFVTPNYQNLPFLYRYRAINPYTIGQLLNNELWGSRPTRFNDPYDSMLVCDKNSLISFIENTVISVFDTKASRKRKADRIASEIMASFLQVTREEFAISCFSETFSDPIMWAHYANSGTGICIAYVTNDIRNIGGNFGTLGPCRYQNGKANCTEFIKEYYKRYPYLKPICAEVARETIYSMLKESEKMFYSLFLSKHQGWKYEKEWRFVCEKSTEEWKDGHCKIADNIKPSAIYLGEHISAYDEAAIRSIITDIPIYKMRTKALKNNFKLVAIK